MEGFIKDSLETGGGDLTNMGDGKILCYHKVIIDTRGISGGLNGLVNLFK